MASYAPLLHSIWEDEDFRALDPDSKLLYLMLFSHRKLSRCGVLDLMPGRWARATGLTDVEAALDQLETEGYVLIDRVTGELAVRSKVKHDLPGSWTQVKSVWRAWEQVESAWLRESLLRAFPAECWDHDKAPPPCPQPPDDVIHTPRPVDNRSRERQEHPDQGKHTPTDGVSHGVCDTPTDGATDTPGRVTAHSPCTLTLHPAPSSSKPSTTDSPPTADPDDDQADRLLALAQADLTRREAEKGPVGNPSAWLASAIAGHRRRAANDPDYLDRAHTATAARPSPLDGPAQALRARMNTNQRRAHGLACATCDDTQLWLDEHNVAHPCPDCPETTTG